jgi:hypothetical protein
MLLVAAGSVLAALIVTPTAAYAAAPTLSSVGLVKRHPTAAWTLPAGVESVGIEVASAPDVASDGSFFSRNRVIRRTVKGEATSWRYGLQLTKPGTYYVHVQGYDPSCYDADPPCATAFQWSNVSKLVVPRPTRPPTPAERRAMLTVLKRGYPPFWMNHIAVRYVRVSNYSRWASGAVVGVGRWVHKVQGEGFAFKRLTGGRWRPYLLRLPSCPPPGMPAQIKRELKIVCY